jgi:hypothetical protein
MRDRMARRWGDGNRNMNAGEKQVTDEDDEEEPEGNRTIPLSILKNSGWNERRPSFPTPTHNDGPRRRGTTAHHAVSAPHHCH